MPTADMVEDRQPQRRADLFKTLRLIDGWGEHGWRLVHGSWRLRGAVLDLDPREGDADPLATLWLDRPPARPGDEADAAAIADWALERLRREVIDPGIIRSRTLDPGPCVRPSTAAGFVGGRFRLRLVIRLPYTGLCCDGTAFARFLRRIEGFLAGLRPDISLRRLRRAVAVQEGLRAALPDHGLIAFCAEGSRLARGPEGGPAAGCAPLRVPRNLRVRIDLGALGVHTGLGIRRGITAIIGAPYHGKSTLIQAIAAGRDNHRPGDGREGVVSVDDLVALQAEEGRPIRDQDLTPFFSDLPGGDPRYFRSDRASGATSMATSLLQALAAGGRTLLIDEDTAAGNFLWMDAGMRRLLGSDVRGRSLSDQLRALAAAGISCVLAVGSATPVLATADRILHLRSFQPAETTRRVRRLVPAAPRAGRPFPIPVRALALGDQMLGDRHFLRVDVAEAERPCIRRDAGDLVVDLRRSGWILDEDLARSACIAAAWCLRLTGAGCDLTEASRRYHRYLTEHGLDGLDPFATTLLVRPPWQLVVSVLERLRLG